MFDNTTGREKALLVHVKFTSRLQPQADLAEFKELCKASGAEIVEVVTTTKDKPAPKFFVGSGKVEEITTLVKSLGIEVVIFNHELSPSQEKNLEEVFECRVLSRTTLVLDIFAQRARTFEGKLQVELAQLKHRSTRLIRGWTNLDRQKGGIGLRGPGETQLESDRRLLKLKIQVIIEQLAKVSQQRQQHRRTRTRSELSTVALVGYTNAGKSTLFNALTKADVFVADQLFATLDPTLRWVQLPAVGNVAFVDTVGFIRQLPHHLVESFNATLEETVEASILLHVIDANDEDRDDKIKAVNKVLKDIGAELVPQIMVFNKIDLLDNVLPKIERNENGDITEVWISSVNNQGLDLLEQAIAAKLSANIVSGVLHLKPNQWNIRAFLHEQKAILSENLAENGDITLQITVPLATWNKLCKQEPGIDRQLDA